jgi:hypothetical protein
MFKAKKKTKLYIIYITATTKIQFFFVFFFKGLLDEVQGYSFIKGQGYIYNELFLPSILSTNMRVTFSHILAI